MSRRSIVAIIGLAALAGVGIAAVAVAEDEPMPPVSGPVNPTLADQGVVWHGNDLGKGERVLLVLAGSFQSQEAAEDANAGIAFGDLQGYYVAKTDQFAGLRSFLGPLAKDHVLVTAFRTEQGANEFLELAAAAGAPAQLTPRLSNSGDVYVGLGQEAHPDGTGPLIGPLPGVST
jgi:hypothetical protein